MAGRGGDGGGEGAGDGDEDAVADGDVDAVDDVGKWERGCWRRGATGESKPVRVDGLDADVREWGLGGECDEQREYGGGESVGVRGDGGGDGARDGGSVFGLGR